jgi:hypothetical protein
VQILLQRKSSITCYESVSATLAIQQAMRMSNLSTVACPALKYFSALSHTRHDFRKQVTEYKTRVWFSLQLLSETFLILRSTEGDMITTVHRSACKVSFILIRSSWNLTLFRKNFWKILKYKISWKSVKWDPSCWMRRDGQTDRHDEANSRFKKTLRTCPKNSRRRLIRSGPSAWLMGGGAKHP